MALTNNTLPALRPRHAVPLDAALQFADNQTLTATGYINNIQTQIDLTGSGRFEGYLVLDISAMDLASTDETYKIFLLGSNIAGWTNGTVEILATRDFAAVTADRLVPTIVPASYAVPTTGHTSTRFVIPFCNWIGDYGFRYLQLYLVAGGTTPSITLASAYITGDFC